MDIPQELFDKKEGRLTGVVASLRWVVPAGLPASRQFDHRQGYRAALQDAQQQAARADEVIVLLVQALQACRQAVALPEGVERVAKGAIDSHARFEAENAGLVAPSSEQEGASTWSNNPGGETRGGGLTLPALPPYVYGREAGANEKLYTVSAIERWRDEVFAAISSSALESARAQFPVEQVRWWAEALKTEPQVGAINGALVISMLGALADVLEQAGGSGGSRWLEQALGSFLRSRGYERSAGGEASA